MSHWRYAMFDEAILQAIRQAIRISDVAREYGFELHRDGSDNRWKARCHKHTEKDGSLTFYDEDASFHCFGCGEHGSVFDLVMDRENLTFPQAVEKLARRAGISLNGRNDQRAKIPATAPTPKTESKPEQDLTPKWKKSVTAFNDDHAEKLATWRGYSAEFVAWLRQRELIGVYNGLLAFPVHADDGKVVSIHVRRKDGNWFYHPSGCEVRALVIGDEKTADVVLVFESQWDAFAVMDKLLWHKSALPGVAVIVTRGAGNGKLLRGLVKRGAVLYAFKQNDVAADRWLADVVDAATGDGAIVRRVATPEQFKDVNEWTKAGATGRELNTAIEVSKEVKPTTPAGGVVQLPGDCDDEMPQQPFPTECLQAVPAEMSGAIAAAERVNESLSGCCVLGILSASIGAGLQVRSGAKRTTSGNLYIVPSVESGGGKSETIRRVVRPLYQFEAEIVERWRAETLPRLQAERDVLESELAQAKKVVAKAETAEKREEIRREMEEMRARLNQLELELQAPVLTCEDITTERLAALLAKHGECLTSISADAGSIINNVLGRYNKLDRTDETIYLKGFSRDPVRVDRVSREPVFLHEPCLSALWLVQPDKIETLLSERSLTEGGLIPRLLMCHTNCQPRYITPDQIVIGDEISRAWDELIRGLLQTYRLAPETYTVEPDPKAMRLLNDHHNCIVDKRRGELKDINSFAARWNEQAWRIAVVLHAAQHSAQAHEHNLSFETARDAITIADWFAIQQQEILSGGRMKARRDKRNEVLLLLAEYPEGITARFVQRARIVSTAEDARELLAAMEQEGILLGKDVTPDRGGWTVRLYTRKPAR